ncbi:MAG: ligase-associated DNA damage response endonuclease PdeM [Xanthobacteraceae bacterium]
MSTSATPMQKPKAACSAEAALTICDITLVADCGGVLYWPEERLLAVADLHFEKGSSFATRGMLLPPYDTAATLARLTRLIARYAPRTVIALGDSFHDGGGPARLAGPDRDALKALQAGRDWIWIAGNHDPDPSDEVGGTHAKSLALGPIMFRHEPTGHTGEIAGHLHPSARIYWRGRSVIRRCFAADSNCMVMPAFGAYTGGLSIRDRAFAAVFRAREFTAHVLGDRRVYVFSSAHCL